MNNVHGELVIDNSGGGIYLNNISGTAILSTIEGNIRARFNAVNAGQPMAFSSMDGSIDIMFPEDYGAILKLKSVYGKIVSDFALSQSSVDNKSLRQEPTLHDNGWQFTRFGDGGAQIVMITYNGNIYIRANR